MDSIERTPYSVRILSVICTIFLLSCVLLCCIGYVIHRQKLRRRKRSQINPDTTASGAVFAIQMLDGSTMAMENISSQNHGTLEKPPPPYEAIENALAVPSSSSEAPAGIAFFYSFNMTMQKAFLSQCFHLEPHHQWHQRQLSRIFELLYQFSLKTPNHD